MTTTDKAKRKAKRQELLAAIDELSLSDIKAYLNDNFKGENLSPEPLGKIFEKIAQPIDGCSRAVSIQELLEYHHSFQSTNGCQWARTNTSWLGQRYVIDRKRVGGKVSSIKLCGFNKSITKWPIATWIRKSLKNEPCALTDVVTDAMEIDHKNGMHNDPRVADVKTQVLEDFQPFDKKINDAKRQHCEDCEKTGCRFKASRLGFCVDFIKGDENRSCGCEGCFWHDCRAFFHEVSKSYVNHS